MIDADTCERILHAALAQGDIRGVDAALRVMARQDPQRAARLMDQLRTALDSAVDAAELDEATDHMRGGQT